MIMICLCIVLSNKRSDRVKFRTVMYGVSVAAGNRMVPPCAERWCEMENWATTPFSYCTVQARRLSLFGYIARMSDKSDAKQILTVSPLEKLEETTGSPCTTWMKTTQQDLKSLNLYLNEPIAQNRPLWRMMSMFGVCLHTTRSGACQNEWMNEWLNVWPWWCMSYCVWCYRRLFTELWLTWLKSDVKLLSGWLREYDTAPLTIVNNCVIFT